MPTTQRPSWSSSRPFTPPSLRSRTGFSTPQGPQPGRNPASVQGRRNRARCGLRPGARARPAGKVPARRQPGNAGEVLRPPWPGPLLPAPQALLRRKRELRDVGSLVRRVEIRHLHRGARKGREARRGQELAGRRTPRALELGHPGRRRIYRGCGRRPSRPPEDSPRLNTLISAAASRSPPRR